MLFTIAFLFFALLQVHSSDSSTIAPSDCGFPYQIAIRCDSYPKKKSGGSWSTTDGVDFGCSDLVEHCNELYDKSCFTDAIFNGRRYDAGTFCGSDKSCVDSSLIGVQTYVCLGCEDDADVTSNSPACEPALASECSVFPHMVAMFCGKVNRHLQHGRWVTDADGTSGCIEGGNGGTIAEYCDKVYGGEKCHGSAVEAGQEFIDKWCERGNNNCVTEPRITDVYVCPSEQCARSSICAPQPNMPPPPPVAPPTPIDAKCPNKCSGRGTCTAVPNRVNEFKCECNDPFKGDDCSSLQSEFSKCFDLPIPDSGDDGGAAGGLLDQLKNVCVEVEFAECEVEFKVKLGPIPIVEEQLSAADIRRFASGQGIDHVPLGFCVPPSVTELIGGCDICANFTNLHVSDDDTSLSGCGKLHASCKKIPLPIKDFDLGCFPDTAVSPACFANCGGSNCNGHGTCVNGLNCDCQPGYGGLDCDWTCPDDCNAKKGWGKCTKDGCRCMLGNHSGKSCATIAGNNANNQQHPSPGQSPADTNNDGNSGNAGMIMAGVGLGVLVILLVAGIAFYVMKKRSAAQPRPYSSLGASLMLDDDE